MTTWLRSSNWFRLSLLLGVIGLVWSQVPVQARLTPDNFPFTPAGIKAAASKSTTASVQEGYLLYQVQRGDNLYRIARKYNVDRSLITRVNGISDPDRIQAGQSLKIPGTRSDVVAASARSQMENLTVALEQQPIPSRTVEWPVNGLDEGLDWIASDWNSTAETKEEQDGWQWPLQGRITLAYGAKDADGFHHGIDIAAPTGETIRAAAGGRVVFSGMRPVYGRTVVINHGNGMASLYAHASRLLVSVGDQVTAGQEISLVGNSGNSRGSHLHFEIYQSGKTTNPIRYLPSR